LFTGVVKLVNNYNNSKQKPEITEVEIAALGVIGGIISTFGGGLQTIASILALQDIEQEELLNKKTNNNKSNDSKQNDINREEIKKMQKQIDTLSKEIKQIKRLLTERK